MALADNKTKIQALLDGINALPEAGSGEAPDPVLQEKSITPTKQAQAVTPDTGYDGLSKVNVGAIPAEYIVPSGTVSITENGTHNVREAESVNVNVDAPDPTLQEKTVSPSTAAQEITPDGGYDGLSKVTVNAMPIGSVGNPTISVNSSGVITATAAVEAGYVDGTDKTGTKQLTTQGAQTITPGTSDKTITSGRYLTGTQTIKGDANLVAGNIKSGVSVFGVAGSLTEGEDVSAETAEYTSLLTDLETAIDALPDAGSGGDKTPGTCTVEIQNVTESIAERTIYVDGLLYETVTNGEKDIYIQEEANAFEIGQGESAYINNVLHGGLFILFDSDAYDGIANIKEITTTNAEYLGDNLAGSFVFRIGDADADAIIEVSK